MADIFEGTSFDVSTAEVLLDFSEGLDWSLPEQSSGFVWYSWNRACFIRMLYEDGGRSKPPLV